MRALLDTHAFLWWAFDDPRLPQRARRAVGNVRNQILFSVVTAWEIVIKLRSEQLKLGEPPASFIRQQLEDNAFEPLGVNLDHSLALAEMPQIHGDPFDRLLIAQALTEGIPIISGDRMIGRYPVRTYW